MKFLEKYRIECQPGVGAKLVFNSFIQILFDLVSQVFVSVLLTQMLVNLGIFGVIQILFKLVILLLLLLLCLSPIMVEIKGICTFPFLVCTLQTYIYKMLLFVLLVSLINEFFDEFVLLSCC